MGTRFTGDYHTHSNYSDGRATIEEMAEACRKKGLREMAITDHGPRNVAGGLKNAAKLLEISKKIADLNEVLEDFQVLSGVEANIIDEYGRIDVPKEVYKELDVLIIGLHPYILTTDFKDLWNLVIKNQFHKYLNLSAEKVINYNTKVLKEACIRYKPFAISHPGLGMPVEVDEIAKTCTKTGVAYEINCGHLYQTVDELKQAAAQGVEFVINSDAHFTKTVGELDSGLKLAQKAGIPMDRIRNVTD